MIGTFRSKKTIEAIKWDGENKQEFEDFFGKENITWTLFSNDFPIPEIRNAFRKNTASQEIELGDYIVENEMRPMVLERTYTIYSKNEFESEFERI